MNNKTLLPPTATLLERNVSEACQINLDVDLRFLWDPCLCPVNWLPFLAWQYSVDSWDEDWSEQIKRKVIADSYLTHKVKGTVKAIKRAVEPFGYVISIDEWFKTNSEPGTFSLEIGVLNEGITADDYTELTRLINDVKTCSRHITGLSVTLVTQGLVKSSAAIFDGSTTTIYPYLIEKIMTSGRNYYHATTYSLDTLEVSP